MAMWVDISHLEPPSDEGDNSPKCGRPTNPSTLGSTAEASRQQSHSFRDQYTESSLDEEKACSADGFNVSATDDPATAEPSTSASDDQDYHISRHVSRSQDAFEAPKPRSSCFQREINVHQRPEYLSTHGIMFSITCSNNTTVAVPSDCEEETPLLYTADTETAHNAFTHSVFALDGGLGSVRQQADVPYIDMDLEETDEYQEVIIGLGIASRDVFRHRISTGALVVTTEHDEDMIFSNVDQEDFDRLLAAAGDVCANAESANHNLDSEADDEHWVEFAYREDSPWDIKESGGASGIDVDSTSDEIPGFLPIQNNTEGLDVYAALSKTTQHDLDDTEVVTSPSAQNLSADILHNFSPDDVETDTDYPLSHFQPLPIGPFTAEPQSPPVSTSTTGHHHSFPKLTRNSTTGAINVTHLVDEHWDCPVFRLARYVAVASRGPVPLSRRVHELQGLIEEDRRGLREYKMYKKGWKVKGSSLRRELNSDREGEGEGECWEQ